MAIFIPVIGVAALGIYFINRNPSRDNILPESQCVWKKVLEDIEKSSVTNLKKINIDKIHITKLDEELKNALQIRRKKIEESLITT